MKKRWIAASAILTLALAIGGWAEAVNLTDDDCLGEVPRIVDTPAEAVLVGNGWSCSNVDLTILISLTTDPAEVSLPITAKTITITGPDPGSASGRVEIIKDVPLSTIFLTATGNIMITEGSLKAHKTLKLTSTAGDITVTLSELVAALLFGPPPSPNGGDVVISAGGSVDIRTTTTHGGDILEITAKNGSITLLCLPGEGGCRDPFVSSKAVELCDTTGPGGVPDGIPDFPCTVNFPTPADLRAVCIQAPGVTCNGGSKEKRFTAKGDIDITGSTIPAVDHMTFTSTNGRLLASGANLSAESIVANIKGDGTSPSINLEDATLTTSAHIQLTAGSGCPAKTAPLDAADICINANSATITASNIIMTANFGNGVIDLCESTIDDVGADFPTFNGDTTPPFSKINGGGLETILDDAADCAVLGKGPGTIS